MTALPAHARAIVVGGGCVGVATLLALARRGWTDSVLLERTRLTAGSTWHAAGLIPSYTRSFAVGRMIAKSIELYEGLEAVTGQSVGWRKCGQLRIANTRERLDEFRNYMGVAEAQGTRAFLLTPAEARALWPLHESEAMLAALHNPDDGHIAPADVTMAMAKGARDLGARVVEGCEATSFSRTLSGEWRVTTGRGDIACEHLVLATGNYARQTGAKLGLDLPAIPIVHQYWVTEAVPEIRARRAAGLPELPILRDEAFAGYVREEGEGLMFGPYERPEKLELFAVDGVPASFGADLLPEDFDAVAEHWETAARHVPALGRAGIKTNVRGPFQMTADELPLAGPASGLDNVWLAEGVPGGILWGGALGHYLSEWIVDGGTSLDMSELDPRRFGDYANKAWTKAKVRETWGYHAEVRWPEEERPAARPAKTAPSYDMLTARGAVWSALNGWEMPKWFAPSPAEAVDVPGFRRGAIAARVGEEVAAVRHGVGLVEMTPMTKFEVSGADAAAWLDRLVANRLPRPGRIALCHALNPRGGVEAEYTIAHLADGTFYLISTPNAERRNFDVLTKHLPARGEVRLSNVTAERGAFTILGPQARPLIADLAETDLASSAFPWLATRTASVGPASDVRLLRIDYSGELGWELYHPIGFQRALLTALLAAGEKHGLRLVGLSALESLRLDKSYRAMTRDMNSEMTALESGLDRFLAFDKGDFIGRAALEKQRASGLKRRLVTLVVDSADGTSVQRDEGVYRGGRLVGRVTSGGYSHHFGHDIALALLPVEFGAVGTELEIPVIGERRSARVVADSPYDPANARLRS